MVCTGTQSKLSSKHEIPEAVDTLHMVTNPTVSSWDLGHTVVLMPVTSLSDVLYTGENCSHKVTDEWDLLLS